MKTEYIIGASDTTKRYISFGAIGGFLSAIIASLASLPTLEFILILTISSAVAAWFSGT